METKDEKVIWKLLPFMASVGLYGFSDLPLEIFPETKLAHLVLKCIPVLCLLVMLLLHPTRTSSYSLLLQAGLLSSVVGDACLVYEHLFFPGVGAFGLAHILYVVAFGMSPPAWPIGGVTSVFALSVFYTVALPIAKGPFVIVFLLYTIVIGMMFWRAAALCTAEQPHWTNWTAAAGAAAFIFSDVLLLVNKFHFTLPAAQLIILGLYWAAQAGIAISVFSLPSSQEVSRKTQ
ncbi:lysoplasmalogenase TMEM86A-like [Sycon ciliatum]|uniref:lysoplasmalogenase TMEM86A-like n=1 Tax=Sycon ciliatum TaxID=27933 RepID=UPI0031F6E191